VKSNKELINWSFKKFDLTGFVTEIMNKYSFKTPFESFGEN